MQYILFWLISMLMGSSAVLGNQTNAGLSIVIGEDGTIAGVPFLPAALHSQDLPADRYEVLFGMPAKPPQKRWMENNSLPIYQTTWEDGGIRYTQVVLLAPLSGSNEKEPDAQSRCEVLMVRITGQCLASEYTEASAAFGVKLIGRKIHLSLLEDLVFPTSQTNSAPWAQIDIPSGGIASRSGPVLQFKANMPPSERGGMTIKIPLRPLAGEEEVKLLRQLDFNEELPRLKAIWTRQIKAGKPVTLPIRFASEENPINP